MEIRWAKEEDLERLVEIFNYEVLNGVSSFCIETRTVEERRGWFEEHDRACHPLIVAEVEGEVAGYASLSAYRSYEAYHGTVELSIYVDHRFQRRRVGASLMEEILHLAREQEGIHSVLSVITEGNEASICLHEKFQFTFCGALKEVGKKFGRYLDVRFYELIV